MVKIIISVELCCISTDLNIGITSIGTWHITTQALILDIIKQEQTYQRRLPWSAARSLYVWLLAQQTQIHQS